MTACKGGLIMSSEMRMTELEEENRRLREENEKLLAIIDQMRMTMNRLIGRYMTEKYKK